ncbi:MAG TPA: glycosyltransferase family 1 protein [Nitrospiraceae bacterium]|nr:glycosyltransferase family 1 protein [Nitrospiraceae bacterium]
MRIVIVAWHLKNPTVGLGRYCRELVEAIGRTDVSNHYEILMPDGRIQFPRRPNIRYRLVRFPFFRRRFWEQAAPFLAGPHDLLHFPYDSCVAWKRGRFVATIHDAKPLLFPELRPKQNLSATIERLLVGDPRAKLDHVITISDSSRRDLIRYLGVAEDRITAVPLGIDSARFRPAKPAGPGAGRPYVMSLAGADPTKNIAALVRAFAAVPERVRRLYDLVLVGDVSKRPDVRDAIERERIASQTRLVGVVSDEELIGWYQGASVFVFPSLYEGFGLPVLEAMACGIPVLCSNSSSLPEVAGDAAILVDPRNIEQLASELTRTLDDASLRQELSERGRTRALTFSWDRTAAETVAVYERVGLSRSPRPDSREDQAAE